MYPDAIDRARIRRCATLHAQRLGPRIGDYIHFADGSLRRIGCTTEAGGRAQDRGDVLLWTCPPGQRLHLKPGGMAVGDYLLPPITTATLTLAPRTRPGPVWIWRHGQPGLGRRVTAAIACRVYRCTLPPPRHPRHDTGARGHA